MTATSAEALANPFTDEQIRAYREDGVAVLHDVVPPAHLELLRAHCRAAMDAADAEMDQAGVDVLGINRRGDRYFAAHPSIQNRALFDFISGPLMLAACRALLGPDVWVFWEQYVVKGPEKGMHFSWHQDSGYVDAESRHAPYLTCWVALDDMSEANGTVHVLPQRRVGIRSRVEHVADPAINDLVGYFGADPGDPVVCRAGSIAFFSSVTFHRSGWNRTPRLRRSYLIQYSGERIRRRDGTAWGRVEPVLRGGAPVPPSAAPALGRYAD